MSKTLIIIDCQNDIVNIDGSFHIDNAEDTLKNIERFIKESNDVTNIIMTQKMYPKNHYSFIENRGQTQSHCVVNTNGCKIVSSLLKTIRSKKITDINTITYNTLKDQIENSPYSYSETVDYRVVLKSAEDYAVIHNKDVIICGTSDCRNMINAIYTLIKIIGNDHVEVLNDGIMTDDQYRFEEFIKETNVRVVDI